jgi:hypothetical protein
MRQQTELDLRSETLADNDPLQPLVRGQRSSTLRLKLVFDVDIETCPECGGRLRVIACVEDPPLIAKILSHIRRREALFDSTPRAPPGSLPLPNLTPRAWAQAQGSLRPLAGVSAFQALFPGWRLTGGLRFQCTRPAPGFLSQN